MFFLVKVKKLILNLGNKKKKNKKQTRLSKLKTLFKFRVTIEKNS